MVLVFCSLQSNGLNFLAGLNLAALHTAGGNGAAAGDGEHVLNRHQERLVGHAVGGGDVAVNRFHQVQDALVLGGIRRWSWTPDLQGCQDDGGVVAGNSYSVSRSRISISTRSSSSSSSTWSTLFMKTTM